MTLGLSAHLPCEPIYGTHQKFLTHSQFDSRPTVTFLASGYHRPFASMRLYCLVTEAGVRERLAHGVCTVPYGVRVEPATWWSQVQHSNDYAVESHFFSCEWE